MIVIDFDGTIADTFQQSPNGIGVTEAYERAILSIFGGKGNDLYHHIGGLKNRTPTEAVVALLASAQNCKEEIVANAKIFHEKESENLSGLVPKGKGAGLVWGKANPEPVMTEMLVLKKLQILTKEICPQWPKPFVGVVFFLMQCWQHNVKVAILSSGHQIFIENVFRMWGVQCPTTIVTDDDLRGKLPYLSKPDTKLIEIVEKAAEERSNIYLGDDPVKDGELAVNAGIAFGWFNPLQKKFSGVLPKNTLQFQSWGELSKCLF